MIAAVIHARAYRGQLAVLSRILVDANKPVTVVPGRPVLVVRVIGAGCMRAATRALVQVREVHVHQHAFGLAIVQLSRAIHDEPLTGRFRLNDDIDHLSAISGTGMVHGSKH